MAALLRMSVAERNVQESPIIYHHPHPLLYNFFPLFPPFGGGDKRTLVAGASAILDTASIIIDDGGKTFGTESDGEDKRAISGSPSPYPTNSIS